MFESMRYVYQVYKEASFSKAAQNLFISQPSLSAHIKKEEERLGVKLFNRNTTPIQLTPPGEVYIKSIEKIMEIEEDYQQYINDFQNLQKGFLAIGANNIYTSFLLPQIIKEYHQHYPDIQITITEGSTSLDIRQALEKGITDIALDNFPTDQETCSKHLLFRETLYLVIPRHFAINQQLEPYQLDYEDIVTCRPALPSLPKEQFPLLQEIPFVGLKRGSDNRRRMDTVMSRYNLSPKIEFELDQSPSAFYIASSGLGATFSSGTLLRNTHHQDDLYFYHIDEPEFHRNVYIYTKKNKYLSKIITEFFRIATESDVIKSDY